MSDQKSNQKVKLLIFIAAASTLGLITGAIIFSKSSKPKRKLPPDVEIIEKL